MRATGYFDVSKPGKTPADSTYDGSLADWLITGADELDNPMTAG